MNIAEKNDHIKQIPYGISDYGRFRRDDYYYVDKTQYLKLIQEAGSYQFLIRPRRFGKSLLLTTMEAYFDVHYKDRFEELFKGTWIFDHPTPDRNHYLVIFFNFSQIEPHTSRVERSFLEHVKSKAVAFVSKYGEYLSTYNEIQHYAQSIKESLSAADILSHLLAICKGANQHLFVIIDEYDNFTNNILSTLGKPAYLNITHGAGFFRSFFNVLKSGTGQMDAPIDRLFITGVSPVTMDDVTSGFNIGKNISIAPKFNSILGFTHTDVVTMTEYYRSKGLVIHPTDYLLEIMTEWYGHYQFSPKSGEKMFNADMVLYFFDLYLESQELPEDLIDSNVRIDYGKLRHLIIIDQDHIKTTNGNFSQLKEIIENGSTLAKLVKSFPLEQLLDTNNFKSLLFYFGLLTIKESERDQLRLGIPNETARRLYYDYISAAYRETGVFAINLSIYANLMTNMAYNGEWRPLFEYITALMRESANLRDLITGEKSIQAFLNVYLGLSDLYILHVERELNKGYVDILLEPFIARYEGIQFGYLIELKYLKTGFKKDDAEVLQLKADAETQIRQYVLDEKMKKSQKKTRLLKLILIFSGLDAVYIESAE